MKSDNIQLIALDLDGTVLTSDKQVTDRTLDAITAVIERGIEIVYITGRPFTGMPAGLMDVRGVNYVVTSNGALTYDLCSKRKLRKKVMTDEAAAGIMEMPGISGLIYSVFIDGIGYSDQKTFEMIRHRYDGTIFEEYVRNSRRPADDITELIYRSDEGVENIWITTPDVRRRDDINAEIKSRWGLRTVLTGHTDVEAGHTACDKGLALSDLAGHLGIRMENVMAIGDNDNDRGMLSEAGFSVAMGNAPDFVKKAAAMVTDTNDNDGVAKVLEKILLQQ